MSNEIAINPLPLNGVRVVDLTTAVMGPYAGQMLGDLGADVIKVESPAGDSTRKTGPAAETGMSSLFLGVNRNKRSVVLDLKQPMGREALLKLVDSADVFIHNIRPQKLEALGITPDELMMQNPRLIYAGLHGFGEGGTYAGMPAYDDTIQGMSGIATLSDGEPRYFPAIIADKTTGLFAVSGILAALVQRSGTGKGAYVEVPMFESMVAFNLVEHLYGHHFVPPRARAGYPRLLSQWRRPYPTSDGYICMMPYTDQHWRAFFAQISAPNFLDDQRFADIASRTKNIDALYEVAGRAIASRTTADWLETCARIDIPASQIADLSTLIDDPHLGSLDFFATAIDPTMGTLRFPGVPLKFDRMRPGVSIPPRLGEHTREALLEAGLDPQTVNAIVASNEMKVSTQSSGAPPQAQLSPNFR
jgi:crotonobetainyl-CoA:carnitine CoA-transferase CaiB-like acyl-CoA transferase